MAGKCVRGSSPIRRGRGRNISRELAAYFETVEITTDKHTDLKIISDGCSGNGFTHWRAIKDGRRLVGCLSNVPGIRGTTEVRLAVRGDLRHPKCHVEQCDNLYDAFLYICETL